MRDYNNFENGTPEIRPGICTPPATMKDWLRRTPLTLILSPACKDLAEYCRARFDVTLLGLCSNGQEALDTILARKPDFAILDLDIFTRAFSQVIRRVRNAGSETHFIVASDCRDETAIRELFRGGCDGYVFTQEHPQSVFDAIDSIRDGWQYLSPTLRREMIDGNQKSDPAAQLSKRQYEIFILLVRGVRPKDIARSLKISPKTVDTHRAALMRKLAIHSVAGLVRFAIARGLTLASGQIPN